jgi:hypothetical protein
MSPERIRSLLEVDLELGQIRSASPDFSSMPAVCGSGLVAPVFLACIGAEQVTCGAALAHQRDLFRTCRNVADA